MARLRQPEPGSNESVSVSKITGGVQTRRATRAEETEDPTWTDIEAPPSPRRGLPPKNTSATEAQENEWPLSGICPKCHCLAELVRSSAPPLRIVVTCTCRWMCAYVVLAMALPASGRGGGDRRTRVLSIWVEGRHGRGSGTSINAPAFGGVHRQETVSAISSALSTWNHRHSGTAHASSSVHASDASARMQRSN